MHKTWDVGLIPGLGRFPGEGDGNSFQHSCLENHPDRRAWRATVHRVAEGDMTEVTEQAHRIKFTIYCTIQDLLAYSQVCVTTTTIWLQKMFITQERTPWAHSVQFSCSVVSDSLRPHESQHARPPCPSPTPGVHWDSHPSSQWCYPGISSSVVPFSSCPQSLPASESFPMSQLLLAATSHYSLSIVLGNHQHAFCLYHFFYFRHFI